MNNISCGDLVWIPAETIFETHSGNPFMMGRTKKPTTGLVIDYRLEGDYLRYVTVLRNEDGEKISVKMKDIRKINKEEHHGATSRSC
mgnify:CR=1 FL=1